MRDQRTTLSADMIAVEDLVDEILRRHDALEPPVDVDAIAAAEGLVFDVAPFVVLKGGYMGMLPDGRAHAFIREADNPLVQRFTKAHELGHHLIERETLPPGYLERDRHPLHERFAAALLMPRAWVDAIAAAAHPDDRELVKRIASTCAVSWPAARIRLSELRTAPRFAPAIAA